MSIGYLLPWILAVALLLPVLAGGGLAASEARMKCFLLPVVIEGSLE